MSIENFQRPTESDPENFILGAGEVISVSTIRNRFNQASAPVKEKVLNNPEFKNRFIGYVLGKDPVENRTEPLHPSHFIKRINTYVPAELREYVLENEELRTRLVEYVLGKDPVENRTEPLHNPQVVARIRGYVPEELKDFVWIEVRKVHPDFVWIEVRKVHPDLEE